MSHIFWATISSYGEDYKPDERFAAGWMTPGEARDFIAKAVALYRATFAAWEEGRFL